MKPIFLFLIIGIIMEFALWAGMLTGQITGQEIMLSSIMTGAVFSFMVVVDG